MKRNRTGGVTQVGNLRELRRAGRKLTTCATSVLLYSTLMLVLGMFMPSTKANPATPIVLWPGGAPGAVGTEVADIPTLTPYLPPKEKATGAAIIICPGGGYTHLADDEGGPVAEWLNSIGVA